MLKTSLPKNLPETPGVYIYYQNKIPIYIGKAINLKRRIQSYFDIDLAPKTESMIKCATSLSFIRVESELESLLLEAKLVRKYMPKYNIELKDDKNPLYITITKDRFPRVITTRKDGSYGPFPSSEKVHSVLKMIRRIFPYSDHKLGKRPCLYSHIGLCNPCPNEIVGITNYDLRIMRTKKYKQNIKNIKAILDGKITNVQKNLEKKMNLVSENQDFEVAAVIRDQIQKLEYIIRPQMPTDYYIQNPNLYEDQRKLEIDDLQKILKSQFLNLKSLTRIECFDISHLSGTNATASMVTFINGEADKKYYRHFKIRQKKSQSDYDSMQEVAKRRAKHFLDWGKPDLITVDGGLGQISSFKINVPVVGIAKNPDRLIVGQEKIKLTGPSLNLVQKIRDEAHRFAQQYHHKLISKSLLN